MIEVPRIGISIVADAAACKAGVAFAIIKSTLFDTNALIIVAQVPESPCPFCKSNSTRSPNFSTNAA